LFLNNHFHRWHHQKGIEIYYTLFVSFSETSSLNLSFFANTKFSCHFIIIIGMTLLLFLSIFHYNYILAGSTRRCPGHYIKKIKCIVRAKVARKVSPKVLHLLFYKLCLKMTEAHGAQVLPDPDYGPKNMLCSH
jgi:hypothetical protein